MSKGIVYLVGAGCGDPELITVKGRRLLETCDVIVYDYLANSTLISYCKPRAILICVGKRKNRHSDSQERINEILVNFALEGKSVLRLKGGDPFVFGRGGEEIESLKENGIPFVTVPGVTSAVAVPESAGIPVTHRGLSRSFNVVTGHTRDDFDEQRLKQLAKEEGTLVFLMGYSNLGKIVRGLIDGGMSREKSCAVIFSGTVPEQRVVRGNLGNIEKLCEHLNTTSPGVIVVGDTVNLDFKCDIINEYLPLYGKKICVAASAQFVDNISERLSELGACVKRVPFIEIEEKSVDLDLLNECKWIAFTSANGVKTFFKAFFASGRDVRSLCGNKIAVIGTSTEKQLKKYGIKADFIPEEFTSRSLGVGLSSVVGSNERVCIYRAENSSDALTNIFESNSIGYIDNRIYSVSANTELKDRVLFDFAEQKYDYTVFASSFGARSFLNSLESGFDMGVITAIGEVTADTVRRAGYDCVVPKRYCSESVIEKILEMESKKCKD